MTEDEFSAAVKARMMTVCDEKEKFWKKTLGKALPAAARTVRLELDSAIMQFARTWNPTT